jgi:RNA polymerase sigma factor (sigma-70 family)
MKHADQKYIDALLNNDMNLLEELYRKFSGRIKWMVLQNNGTEDDAADIFQEALLSIYHKAKTRDFVLTCPLNAFLYLICKNKWLNELSKRKFKNITLIEDDSVLFGEDSFKLAEECALKEQRLNLLSEKLAELGEGCKQLLRLSWSGKSMEEVAEILQVTYGYARKKKSECMAKLVQLVKQAPQFSSLK